MNEQINPYMIILARESKKKSQLELANDLGMKQARLSKIESGLASVDKELLAKLSKVLELPAKFFVEPFVPIDAEYKLHRKQCALKKDELAYISSHSNIIDMNIEKLLNSLDIETNIPEKFTLDYFETPEDIAIAMREYLKIPKGPISDLTNIIEMSGIFIAGFDYKDTKFDGVSFYNKKGVPIIVINKNLPPDRDRFTKAHEYGHIIMHKFPSPNAEEDANRFAAEFLMPKKDIISELNNLSFYSLPNLKMKWKVSMQALIYRAKTLKTISQTREKSLWVQMSRAQYRKEEPAMGLIKEQNELLKNVIDTYQKSLGYSYKELVEYFSISETVFDFLYETPKPDNIKFHRPFRVI